MAFCFFLRLMSGRGKSGVPQKRSQHKVVRDKAFQITSPALKRLARKAGISRIGEEAIWVHSFT